VTTAAMDTTPALRGGEVIGRLIRRLARDKAVSSDLVLVTDDPALGDLEETVNLDGTVWAFRRVRGELSFERTPRGGRKLRAILVVGSGFEVPVDVRDRSFLHRRLDVRIEDILSALTGRPCPPLETKSSSELSARSFRSLRPDLSPLRSGWHSNPVTSARWWWRPSWSRRPHRA